jgi:uncharacterized damage-inducible protein DinB
MELLDVLNVQREHVLEAVAGLSDEELRRPVLPSGWSALGLVSHLAFDVEEWWFRAVLAGEQAAIDEVMGAESWWQVPPGTRAADVIGNYRHQIELASAISTATSLDTAPAWWPESLFGSWRLADHRELLLHVITETACHAGHLDAVRELIDGKQYMVLT